MKKAFDRVDLSKLVIILDNIAVDWRKINLGFVSGTVGICQTGRKPFWSM